MTTQKGIVTLHPVRKLCLAHFLDSFESCWHLLNCVWSVVATSLKTVDCSFECARRKPRKLKNEIRVLHKKQQKWTSDSLFHVFLSEISWLREGIRVAGSYWELATNPSLMLALRGFLLLVNAAHLRREPLPNFLSPGVFSGCSWSRLVFPIPDTFLSLLLQERSIDVQIISIDVQILS